MFYPFFLVWYNLLWDLCAIAAFIVALLQWDYCSSYGFAGIVVGLLCCCNSVAVGLLCCSTAFVLPRPRPRRRAKRGARNLVYIYIYNIYLYITSSGVRDCDSNTNPVVFHDALISFFIIYIYIY